MTSPRTTRLIRAAHLAAMHRALLALATRGAAAAARRRAILVPSRAAAQHLRRTLEQLWFAAGPADRDAAFVLPDIITRHDWYQRMHERAGLTEPRLSPLEREVLLGAAAREAAAAGFEPPFRLRPGLIVEMLAFYDSLRGQQRTVDAFERLVVADLEPRTEIDRGAERLLRQTRFLVAAFRAFEARVAASGKLDEVALRSRLLGSGSAGFDGAAIDPAEDAGCGTEELAAPASDAAFSHVIVAVGDRASEPAGGLYPADFDLLMRLPGIDTIHVVATRNQLAAGFGERIRDLVPEIEEVDADDGDADPVLGAPVDEASPLYFVARDREEELRAIARRVKADARQQGSAAPLDRIAVVFKRPLPYIYLARTVFESAGVPYQAADALPLASEPTTAVLDLVLTCVESRYARTALVALLRSPHVDFPGDDGRPGPDEIEAFDRRLAESGYIGHPQALSTLAEAWTGAGATAARAASAVAEELAPLAARQPVSAHASCLLDFLRAHDSPVAGVGEAAASRHRRARGAVFGGLDELRRAAIEFDDPVVSLADVAATVRRWLESKTFSPRLGDGGVQLVDAQAARFGAFDTVHLAGLAEGDWPESAGRNIFYPSFLLSQLGWPPDSARLAAARDAFVDLLRLPARRVSLSTFTLEDDSIVNPSPLLEELPRCNLRVEREADPRALVFRDEALTCRPAAETALSGDARTWLDLRLHRSPSSDAVFHGSAGPGARRTYTVTAIDRFLQCPFKYFAATVLGLPEDVVDEPSRTPRAQGQFVHDVFQTFFESWQAAGHGAITPGTLPEARRHFAGVADEKLAGLPSADAGIERLRLLGSVGTQGLGEIVLAAEAAKPVPVVERLLEFAFDGTFDIGGGGDTRPLRLRGKADRIDIIGGGRFRVIDYKNGKMPDLAQTIQLPIYAVCLAQQLARTRAGRWEAIEASYIAFGERRPVRPVIGDGPDRDRKLADGQSRLLDAVDRIERGEFPPHPAAPRLCSACAYATVCRKDYAGVE